MKRFITVFAIAFFITVPQSAMADKDARFMFPPNNTFQTEIVEVLTKCFDGKKLSGGTFHAIEKVGDVNVLSLTVPIEGVASPITESEIEHLKKLFDPFLKRQQTFYEAAGKRVDAIGSDCKIENGLPIIRLSILGRERNWFKMKVSFSEQKGQLLVADFTILFIE